MQVNRIKEASALIEVCIEYYKKPKQQHADSDRLPDDNSTQLQIQEKRAFPFRLLVIQCLLQLIDGKEQGILDMLHLLQCLWKCIRKEEEDRPWWYSCHEVPGEEVVLLFHCNIDFLRSASA